MKTLDFLVKELPKLGGWPDGAIGAGFLCGKGTLYFWDDSDDYPSKWRIDTEAEIEDTEIEVSREQYEAALAAKNDGWIEWGGGECPVGAGEMVSVMFRSNEMMVANVVDCCRWNHNGTDSDIIAYRLHKPQEATETDDEDDLNECIGQDATPVWNGLPQVGCVCERSWAGDEWQRCKILFTSNQLVVVKLKESGREDAYNIGDVIFRPIRTEEDKKREAAIKELTSVICGEIPDTGMATAAMYAARVYDAGYRK